nr:T9SS type A sorting domain-containing protein [Ignavibacteria bacterium]
GWAAGNSGTILNTTNGGTTWNSQISNTTNLLNSVCFTDAMHGYIAGFEGTILKTTNGGSVFISENGTSIPEGYYLSQNYPNPFNPVTNLEFGISKLGFVSLRVYDALGKEVAVLVNEKLTQGIYEFKFDASNLVSGVYFYKLETGNFTQTKRMLLIQ